MSLRARVSALEKNPTPQEAMIRWMRESHRFGRLLNYARWLRSQPDDIWPLYQLPRQVTTPAKNRGSKGQRTDAQAVIRCAEKDVVFLFLLHQSVNIEVAQQEQLLKVKLSAILESLRLLAREKTACEDLTRSRLTSQNERGCEADTEIADGHRARACRVSVELNETHTAALVMVGTVSLLSEHYLRGEDLLFPDLRARLVCLCQALEQLQAIWGQLGVEQGPPSDREFVQHLTHEALGSKRRGGARAPAPPQEKTEPAHTRDRIGARAEELVMLARAQTVHLLGDANGSATLMAKLLDLMLGP